MNRRKNVAWLDLILHKVLMPFCLVLREDVLKSLDIFVVINFLFQSEILCPNLFGCDAHNICNTSLVLCCLSIQGYS